MLFTELPDSELVHGGSHILDGLLQVLGVTLHQWLGDAAAAVLWGGKEKCLLEFRGKYDSSGGDRSDKQKFSGKDSRRNMRKERAKKTGKFIKLGSVFFPSCTFFIFTAVNVSL